MDSSIVNTAVPRLQAEYLVTVKLKGTFIILCVYNSACYKYGVLYYFVKINLSSES